MLKGWMSLFVLDFLRIIISSDMQRSYKQLWNCCSSLFLWFFWDGGSLVEVYKIVSKLQENSSRKYTCFFSPGIQTRTLSKNRIQLPHIIPPSNSFTPASICYCYYIAKTFPIASVLQENIMQGINSGSCRKIQERYGEVWISSDLCFVFLNRCIYKA